MSTDSGFSGIDWSVYAALLRKKRMEMRYRSAQDFCRTLWLRTRMTMSVDTLYKIEQGRKRPTVEQFMALNIACFGSPYPKKLMDICLSKEWGELIAAYAEADKNNGFMYDFAIGGTRRVSPYHPYVPTKWTFENVDRLYNDRIEDKVDEAAANNEMPLLPQGESEVDAFIDAAIAESGEPRELFSEPKPIPSAIDFPSDSPL